MSASTARTTTGVALTVDGGPTLTMGDWESRATAVAHGLAARGVDEGSRIALLFDARHWAAYAVAYLGVRMTGATAVLLSPGAAPPDLARAFAHSEANELLRAVDVGDVEPVSGTMPDVGPADLGYPPSPLARPCPWSATSYHSQFDGRLVHAWAPGSRAGQHALWQALAGEGSPASLEEFDPDRLCALVASRGAAALGLTPALAAALLASGAVGRHDLSSLTQVVLSGPPSRALRDGLAVAFPGREVVELPATPAGVPPAGVAPVAPSQEGMVWHEQFTPGSFNLPCLVRRYEGPLDGAALRWALDELARRHEPLRTTFALAHGDALLVDGDVGHPVVEHDVAHLAADQRDAYLADLLADATRRPFDLTTGPLFEPSLVRLGPDDHLVVVRLHHTVFDDWSVDVLRRELSALYAVAVDGAPTPLVEPPTRFSEVTRRRRDLLRGERGDAQRAWWRTELEGAPLAVQLPIAGEGEPSPRDPLRVDFAPALADGLRAVSPGLRATPYMTALAAFAALLSRVTGQDDLVIATVVAHRDSSDVESMIGCFTKKVPVRIRVDGDPSFRELVARTRTALLGALSHQDLAFEAALHEGLGAAAAEHGVVPHVAVVFQGETPQRVRMAMPGLAVGPYEVRAESRRERHFSSRPVTSWGDGIYLGTFLVLSLLATDEGVSVVARGVFDRPACARLLDDYQTLLGAFVAEPDRPASTLAVGVGLRPHAPDDALDVRGFRVSRARVQAALRGCSGVADVALAMRDGRLVADIVVEESGVAPSLVDLRRALWAALPGAPWPADAPGLRSGTDHDAELLAAMWRETAGRPVGPRSSYWQDFSFLDVLAEARAAGLVLDDEHVVRCRTPEALAAARSLRR